MSNWKMGKIFLSVDFIEYLKETGFWYHVYFQIVWNGYNIKKGIEFNVKHILAFVLAASCLLL